VSESIGIGALRQIHRAFFGEDARTHAALGVARTRGAAILRKLARALGRAAASLTLPSEERAAQAEMHALVRVHRAVTGAPPPGPMRRPVLYARTRCGGPEAVEAQLIRLRRCLAERGWAAVAEYCDVGHSASDRQRPGLQRLLADAEGGRFDSVLVIDAARLARDLTRYVALEAHLGTRGVAVYPVPSLPPLHRRPPAPEGHP
jgi:hypothetical protein